MLKFGESKHPVFRSTSPLSPGVLKSKGGGKLSLHFCADEGTIETIFRTVPTQQSQMCVVNANLAKFGTGRPALAGQSGPLFVPTSVMKTEWTSYHNKIV